MDLQTSIASLSRVGKTTSKRLEYLGVKNAQDLLYYFPFRYEDYRKLVPISALRQGDMVTICGQVELIANKRSFRKRKIFTEALVSDKSGSVRAVWFNQPFLIKNIHVGDIIYLSGKVQVDMLGAQLVSPAYEKFRRGETTHTARLVPIYSVTSGLTQKQIRFLVSQVIDLSKEIGEWLPEILREHFDLAPLGGVLRGIHFPVDDNNLRQSAERLKFDELFILQLKSEMARLERGAAKAPQINFKEKEIKSFVANLPFVLTGAQKLAAWEILQDISKATAMNRILSGDVGSGKTVLAALAMYDTVLNGYQAVIMAPTEILAAQHYNSLAKLFEGLDVNVGLLTGNRTDKSQIPMANAQINSKLKISKKQTVEDIRNGVIKIIVGTHALLSENVKFKKLGLVVVDEQHRFGVEQRKLIKEKAGIPPLFKEGAGRRPEALPGGGGQLASHFLSMTATPIPRSLALMLFGDLDVSVIDQMPLGRKQILARVVEPANRGKAYQFIREQVKKGRQAFVICPLIEEKKTDEGIEIINYSVGGNEKKNVMAEYEKLSQKIFPDLKISYLHGKMKSKEKEKIMEKFRKKEIDLLVSTSVVEVGVDIPNASVMMIEGAENFGLAQLHQFRGRVGRSEHQSYCLVFTNSDSQRALERLRFFEKTNNGFKLAEKDLQMRGPGEVYGTEQSGIMNLRLAKLTDIGILKKAREAAKMVSSDLKSYPKISEKMEEWESRVHLE